MKNIYLLPTNKPTRLHIDLIDNSLLLFSDSLNLPHKPTGKHICITSDEAIKDGDWCLFESSGVIRKVVDSTFSIGVNNIRMYAEKKVFKIILTTDPDLIKDSIQAIDDTFLEWFVNNPSCEEVDVCKVEQIPDGITFGMFGNDEPPTELIYKIIIPQEEPEQETLEEAAESWLKSKTLLKTSQAPGLLIGFIEGAKWQAERMYSEDEVLQMYKDYEAYVIKTPITEVIEFSKWFEQFKKK